MSCMNSALPPACAIGAAGAGARMESSLLLRSRAAAAAEGGGGGTFVMAASMSGVKSDPRDADLFAGASAGADAALCTLATCGACLFLAGGCSSGVMLSMAMRSGADASLGCACAEAEARPSMAMMSAPPSTGASAVWAPAGLPPPGAAAPFMNAGTGSASGAGELWKLGPAHLCAAVGGGGPEDFSWPFARFFAALASAGSGCCTSYVNPFGSEILGAGGFAFAGAFFAFFAFAGAARKSRRRHRRRRR